MSASKEAWDAPRPVNGAWIQSTTTRSRGGRHDGAFVRVTRAYPCPVCGHDSWCRVARDGAVALCMRVESGRHGEDDCGRWYVHHLGDVTVRPRMHPSPLDVVPDRAPPEVRDRAYRAVLSALSLDAIDRTALLARGLRDEDIVRNGYRTLPREGRARLALVALDAVGEDLGRRVPGVVRRERDGRAWWAFAGSPGVLIPCRDVDGRVVALKVRRREAPKGLRYSTITSHFPAADGRVVYLGPRAEAALHVPLLTRERLAAPAAATAIVVEGELGSDVVAALSPWAAVALPGVGAWRLALDLAARLRPARVVVALDMDRTVKPDVARAHRALVGALRAEGIATATAQWNPAHKGLADYLAARAAGTEQAR